MYDIQIQNIVASSAIAKAIDLYAIDDKFENTDYDPKTFPGLVYRLKEPKTSVLIFRSGKIVSTGAKTLEEVDRCVAKVVDDLKKAGFDVFDDAKAEVQNIVSSADYHCDINLNTVAVTLGLERVEYEPEQFPGLVYRLNDPKVVILLFGSGKIVITGAKVISDVEIAADKLAQELREAELMI